MAQVKYINDKIKELLLYCNSIKSQIPDNLSDTELFINDNFIMLTNTYGTIKKMYSDNKDTINNETLILIQEQISL
jgi:hypothetical protein